MKIYCQKCGSPHEAVNKPNFCFNCGNSFNGKSVSSSSSSSLPKNTQKNTRSQYRTSNEEDDYDEDEDGSPINTDLAFSASKLDVEIEKDHNSTIKIENVIGSSTGGEVFQRNNENGGYSMDDFRREAGSIKKQ
jgi:uncharacterized Zn finger protein (UPF0148 family)